MTTLTALNDVEGNNVIYELKIPRIELESVTLASEDIKALENIGESGQKISNVLSILSNLVARIEIQNKMYDLEKVSVDHLVQNLEQRSVADVIRFLGRYAGYKSIIAFAAKEDAKGSENG